MMKPRNDMYYVDYADDDGNDDNDDGSNCHKWSGTCVKYCWAWLKFSSVNAKNHPFCEICGFQACFFFHRITGVTLYLSRNLQNILHPQVFAKNVANYALFSGKIENFRNLTSVKYLTNSISAMIRMETCMMKPRTDAHIVTQSRR